MEFLFGFVMSFSGRNHDILPQRGTALHFSDFVVAPKGMTSHCWCFLLRGASEVWKYSKVVGDWS